MPRLRKPGTRQSITAEPKGIPASKRPELLFKPGNPGGPGRPPGSKDKIAQAFFRDFVEVWEREGHPAIERLAKDDPRAFVYAAVAMVPKEVKIDAENRVYVVQDKPLTVEEWAAEQSGEKVIEHSNGDARSTAH